ncbi:hypothetical protein ABZ553_02780 [Streptomyces sparsogenes]|uniref:hypothetical protein n=1 Tax=Streptomyces sparsogenes TaxID=67365 RepID=UPI00340572E5
MITTPPCGTGVTWLKCPGRRLKCRPAAVGADGRCPRCGNDRMLKPTFGGRATQPARPAGCG